MRILITIILAALMASAAHAQSGDAVRIGVLNDMSGVYSDDQGPGSVIAAQNVRAARSDPTVSIGFQFLKIELL